MRRQWPQEAHAALEPPILHVPQGLVDIPWPDLEVSEGKPWAQWYGLRHVPTFTEPPFSLLSNGEIASSTRIPSLSPQDEKSRRKLPLHLHRKEPQGLFQLSRAPPQISSRFQVPRPFGGTSQNIQKVPALRREAVGPGFSLVSPRAAATTAAPASDPSACLAPSQGWGEGTWAGLEADPLLLQTQPVVLGSGE